MLPGRAVALEVYIQNVSIRIHQNPPDSHCSKSSKVYIVDALDSLVEERAWIGLLKQTVPIRVKGRICRKEVVLDARCRTVKVYIGLGRGITADHCKKQSVGGWHSKE